MKLKLVTLIIFLLCIFTCWSCANESVHNEPESNKQELEIFKTDFKLDQDQMLSQIKSIEFDINGRNEIISIVTNVIYC